MPLYELSPKNLDDLNWRCSIVRKPVIVRAGSCDEARTVCMNRFGIVPDLVGPIPTDPWLLPHLVECQEIEDPRWPTDGPNQILDPPGYED